MFTFKEVTRDHGYEKRVYASDNNAEYILTSAMAHDAYEDYVEKYNRKPSSRWYNKNFTFERIKD